MFPEGDPLHAAPNSSKSSRNPRWAVLIVFTVPIVALMGLAVLGPRAMRVLSEREAAISTITAWFIDPDLPLVVAILYGLQLVALATATRVSAFRAVTRRLTPWLAVGWVGFAAIGAWALSAGWV